MYRALRTKRGFTLLLTLIVLVVLAVVIVQFQAEATLRVRSHRFRLERIQCRYGAESGIIMGARMVYYQRRQPLTAPAAATGQTPDESVLDPNQIDLEQLLADAAEPAGERPPYVILEKILQIGPVSVNVQVHDENAKWPIYWLLRSPFEPGGSTNLAEKGFRQYTRRLGVSTTAADRVIQEARNEARSLTLPPAPVQVRRIGRDETLARRGRRIEYAERVREHNERHTNMSVFAAGWHEYLKHDPESEAIQVEMEIPTARFCDYISMWGTYYLNLNTASEDLLFCAFEQIGLTEDQARSIVEYRRQAPFTNTGQLQKVRALSIEMSNNIRSLCVVKSDTFSLHVEARLGRVRNRLLGGIYFDFNDNMLTSAVFSGE